MFHISDASHCVSLPLSSSSASSASSSAGVEPNMYTLKLLLRLVSAPIKHIRLHTHTLLSDPIPDEYGMDDVSLTLLGLPFNPLCRAVWRESKLDTWPEWPRVSYAKTPDHLTRLP